MYDESRVLAEAYRRVKRADVEGTMGCAIRTHSQACGLVAYVFNVDPDRVARAVREDAVRLENMEAGMGWSFGMEIDVGSKDMMGLPFEANYTYNVSPMFEHIFGDKSISRLDGLTGECCNRLLRAAIESMVSEPEVYIPMGPKNGMGNYEGAVELLRTLLSWCERAPKAVMKIR